MKKKLKVKKFKDVNEYREMWNMLNTREYCLKAEIQEIQSLKTWIDRRNPALLKLK